MVAEVHLLAAKEKSALKGHPWIFPKAIAKIIGEATTGMLVAVHNSNGQMFGFGIYNEHSLYRVRMLSASKENYTPSLEDIIAKRLQQAVNLRHSLNLPRQDTNVFRLVNSEGDGLSGLTIDFFAGICVVSSSAYWVEKHKQCVQDCLERIVKPQQIIWFSQQKPLRQDGWRVEDRLLASLTTEVQEDGVKFCIDFTNPQKTGLFIDQRENHQRLAQLAKGKSVLDLYTYSGGFALHAARAGASRVTAVDSSVAAIELACENAKINSIENIDFIAADARNFLSQAGNYDIVVLDPPKLIPSKQDLAKAKNYYRFLHREVLKVMRPGSLLLSCNCSSALSAQEFNQLIAEQALHVNKELRTLGIFGPALCHPTLAFFPEGQYLTAVLAAVV